MVIYSTNVQEIGENADKFLEEGMIVLFGTEAPPELRPFCFLIVREPLEHTIQPGDTLLIGGESYQITAVGGSVNKNLRDIGHITINFTGETTASMAGTLYVEDKPVTLIKKGTILKIQKGE